MQEMRHRIHHDDADVAAGLIKTPTSPISTHKVDIGYGHSNGNNSNSSNKHNNDSVTSRSNKMLVLGVEISRLDRQVQFYLCAAGVFSFTLVYGYLQELISVQLFNRKLGLFLAVCQFSGYSFWSFVMRNYIISITPDTDPKAKQVPLRLYLGISLLRAFDLGMTNMAMMYINYPAKTLMKSSRVVWTMGFGVIFGWKKYPLKDYLVVFLMVSGLIIFMHADANSAAVFQPLGIIMLTASLMSDGAIGNLSESLMTKYHVGQDEFIFRLYSLSLIAISAAATVKGDLMEGIQFLSVPGTMEEIELNLTPTWTVANKIRVIVIFSTFGFFGSSCSAAITKHFGAFTMSITSTARKATTLFLSFLLFPNHCTWEHICGIILFMISLFSKTIIARRGASDVKSIKRIPAKHNTVYIV